MTPTPTRIAALMLGVFLVLTVGVLAQQHPEVALRAAMELETVRGDLRAAIEEYKQIAQGSDRALAAKALIRMAGCYQKLGDAESRTIYEQVVRDYADQNDAVTVARARLATLDQPRSPVDPSTMVVRRVWSGRSGQWWVGGVSPGGRYLSNLAWNGDHFGLAIHDLETGENRPLANEDSWSGGDVRSHKLSPDGTQVAYVWRNRDSFNEVRRHGYRRRDR